VSSSGADALPRYAGQWCCVHALPAPLPAMLQIAQVSLALLDDHFRQRRVIPASSCCRAGRVRVSRPSDGSRAGPPADVHHPIIRPR
jgi:hypothetical protein